LSAPRILIVEDSPTSIQALVAILRERGYQLSVTTNGRQALELLASVRPELILLDVMMPEVDGFETCARLKANPEWRDIPVIFLTARTDPDDIVRGFEVGAVDYVVKPFHSPELLARVATHLSMDRLRKENERLIRAESEVARHRSVAQMVAGVAHEINTPLGILSTAASLLNRWVTSPTLTALSETAEGRSMLEDLVDVSRLVERNTARAQKLVQDFKKVSVHQITDILEEVRFAELVGETVDLFLVGHRQSPLQVRIQNDLPAEALWFGYAGTLSQVLLNLLSNARRYAYPPPSPGQVEIRLAQEEECYTLTVSDYGAGIAPEHLPRVFEPFFTTGRGQGGSGLGLSIVHTLVTAHLQGELQFESRAGEGTTVSLRLPLRLSV
jgi:signal transduction histidine kinase